MLIFLKTFGYIFQDPIAAKPWTGRVLDATKEGPTCLQNDLLTGLTQVGQEDCLVLNVYTHKVLNQIGQIKFYNGSTELIELIHFDL